MSAAPRRARAADAQQLLRRPPHRRPRALARADADGGRHHAVLGLSGDYHPLHADEEFARGGPFGKRIAQGCLALSLATGLEFSLMGAQESRVLAFYGMDRVRLTKPVFIGDTLHLEGTVTALEEKDEHRGVVTLHQEIKDQRGETVAVLDKRTLQARRPAN